MMYQKSLENLIDHMPKSSTYKNYETPDYATINENLTENTFL